MYLPLALLAVTLALPSIARAQQTPPKQPDARPVFTLMEWEAAASDPKAYTIDPTTVEIVRLSAADIGIALPKPPPTGSGPMVPTPPAPPGGGTTPGLPPFPGGDLGGGIGEDPITTIDRIVNLAKKIFDIIKENQPVIDITTSYANAIPDAITHWTQLAGWSQPATTNYAFYAKNMYGSRVITCKYQVIRQYAGNYKGKGKFLTSVTVQPLEVSASWGYKFGMKFEAPSVSNVGSSEDPVASMLARLNWSIDTVLKHEQGTSVYYLQGDGAFRELGGPFKNESRETARQTVEKISSALPALPARGAAEATRARAGMLW